MNNVVLHCEGLSKSFRAGSETLPILDAIDLSVDAGELVAIVGASGSGKSTLLHLLGGLEAPESGAVYWGETLVNALGETERCRLRNVHLGFIYQFHHLLGEFTALENIALPLFIRGLKRSSALAQAAELLNAVGLAHRGSHKIGQLSGGERQRVAIARALVTRPRCVLADEPTGNLDAHTAALVFDLMLSLQSQYQTSFVVVTHDLHLAEKLHKLYTLDLGKLTQK